MKTITKYTDIKIICDKAMELANIDINEALSLGERALSTCESVYCVEEIIKAKVYHTLQVIYYLKNEYEKSYTYGNLSIIQLDTEKDEENIVQAANIFRYLSLVSASLGNFDKEYTFALKSKELAFLSDDNLLKYNSLETLIFCSYYKKRYDDQLNLLKISIELALKLNNNSLLSVCYNNIADIYINLNQLPLAKAAIDNCKKYRDKNITKKYQIEFTYTQGEYELKSNNKKDALVLFEKVLDYIDSDYYTNTLCKTVLSVSKIYRENKNYSQAITILSATLHRIESTKFNVCKSDILLEISKNYELLEDYSKALNNFKAYNNIVNNNLKNIDKTDNNKLGIIYSTEEIKHESEYLKLKNKEQKNTIYKLKNELEKSLDATLKSILELVRTRSIETTNHINRTKHFFKALADKLLENKLFIDELNSENIFYMIKASQLHDIGKIGIPDSILLKAEKLGEEEFEIMKSHTTTGYTALNRLQKQIGDSVFFSYALDIAHTHHERWDGLGYPRGLKGSEIPLCGRIMAVIDVYDALISKRAYKDPLPHSETIKRIKKLSEKNFDPVICSVFVKNHNIFREIALDLVDCYEEYESLKR